MSHPHSLIKHIYKLADYLFYKLKVSNYLSMGLGPVTPNIPR